jgi:adenylate cyclase
MAEDNKEPSKSFKKFTEQLSAAKRIASAANMTNNGKLISDIDQGFRDINSHRLSTLAFSDESEEKQLQLQEEINDLKRKHRTMVIQLKEANDNTEEARREKESLENEIKSKEQINHILPRLSEQARTKLLEDESFRLLFKDASSCKSVVISIDIRRSTELMLKARKPELFSKFITDLSEKLSEAILGNFGVFDKFTGDGILAFFPDFYSGTHAIVRALKAAAECHAIFIQHYYKSRESFNVFIKDVGLGIGIDFGTVTLVNTRNELTVVGIPVVYACRMGGAKAGQTLLNQPAIEELELVYAGRYIKIETEIEIKNEGTALAYEVLLNDTMDLELPNWLKADSDDVTIDESSQTPADEQLQS